MKHFNLEDASQVAIGAFALAAPISFSEEAWQLGETLAMINLLHILIFVDLFSKLFTLQSIFQGNVSQAEFLYLFAE